MYRRSRVNIQPFCIQPWIYIFNSFVSLEVKPSPQGVTKLVYCLFLMPPLTTPGCGHILLSIPKSKRTTVTSTFLDALASLAFKLSVIKLPILFQIFSLIHLFSPSILHSLHNLRSIYSFTRFTSFTNASSGRFSSIFILFFHLVIKICLV